jgi:hypothetical protein
VGYETSSPTERDYEFESHSGQVCLRLFCVCFVCVGRGLATAAHPSKESYRLSTRFVISERFLNGKRPGSLIHRGRRRIIHFHAVKLDSCGTRYYASLAGYPLPEPGV